MFDPDGVLPPLLILVSVWFFAFLGGYMGHLVEKKDTTKSEPKP